MRFFTLLSLPYFALALAGPTTTTYNKCLSDQDSDTYINAFASVLAKQGDWRATGKKYFAKNMVSISDSDSFYEQIAPLNSTLFSSRTAFLDYISTKSGATFNTLFSAHSCNTITWYAQFAPGGIPVRIMQIFFIDTKNKKIYKNYWEYNTGVLLALESDECKGERGFDVGNKGLGKKQRGNCQGVF